MGAALSSGRFVGHILTSKLLPKPQLTEHTEEPDLPPAEAKRQIALLRAEVRRLSTRFDRLSATLEACLTKKVELEAGFAIALRERDKILQSRTWRAGKAIHRAMRLPKRALLPVMAIADRSKADAGLTEVEPVPGPSAATDYEQWVEAYDTLSQEDRTEIAAHIERLAHRPVISLVIVKDGCGDRDGALLRRTLASIRSQLYSNWELCLAGDEVPGGAFVALLEPGDLLPEQALYEVAVAIDAQPDVAMIYTDEDKIDEQGRRFDPALKPDFSIELQLGCDLTGRLTVYRRTLLDTIGVSPGQIRSGQRQALAVEAASLCGSARIRHIPAVLCHRLVPAEGGSEDTGSRDPGGEARLAAVARTLGDIDIAPLPDHRQWSRVTWPIPDPLPLVSVIIPTRDRADLLARCLGGLLHRTVYPNLEVLIIDNDSIDVGTHSLFMILQNDARVRVLPVPGPFNYSALNNAAARAAKGDILVMLNNDVDVLGGDWLQEMVSHAVRPDVGAVGAKLLYGDGYIQHAGVVLGVGQHAAGPGVAGHFGHYALTGDAGYLGQFILTRELSAVTGACMAFRRDVFMAVGGLDETALPVAFNDVDFCLRIRAQGFRIIWTPLAELYHLESASRGLAETPEQIAYAAREQDYMRARWGPILDHDPFYNLNFDRKDHTFKLARPPYRAKPWRSAAPLTKSGTAPVAHQAVVQGR
ncbi:MAG: glycosyltransferase [Proteobacteria bacterium]|nr:glycosyltransferase [Pseudomonadota bacterium]